MRCARRWRLPVRFLRPTGVVRPSFDRHPAAKDWLRTNGSVVRKDWLRMNGNRTCRGLHAMRACVHAQRRSSGWRWRSTRTKSAESVLTRGPSGLALSHQWERGPERASPSPSWSALRHPPLRCGLRANGLGSSSRGSWIGYVRSGATRKAQHAAQLRRRGWRSTKRWWGGYGRGARGAAGAARTCAGITRHGRGQGRGLATTTRCARAGTRGSWRYGWRRSDRARAP
jgi:hypothetical protein